MIQSNEHVIESKAILHA